MMLMLIVVLLAVAVIALLSMAMLQGRSAYREHRVEQVRIERHKRWAERRLHDVSSQAFEEMLSAARQPSEPGSA